MRQIMIIDSEFSHYSNLERQLEDELTVEITKNSTIERALSFIPILPELDFILFNSNHFDSASFTKIEKHLIEEKLEIPLLVIGKAAPIRSQSHVLKFNIDSIEFLDLAKDLFIKNDIAKKKRSSSLFSPVELSYLLENRSTPFPVNFYLRIKLSEDEYRLIN